MILWKTNSRYDNQSSFEAFKHCQKVRNVPFQVPMYRRQRFAYERNDGMPADLYIAIGSRANTPLCSSNTSGKRDEVRKVGSPATPQSQEATISSTLVS